jgi:hypothetical protein
MQRQELYNHGRPPAQCLFCRRLCHSSAKKCRCGAAVVSRTPIADIPINWDEHHFDRTTTIPQTGIPGSYPKPGVALKSIDRLTFFVYVADNTRRALFIRYPLNARAEECFGSCLDMKMTIQSGPGHPLETFSCQEMTAIWLQQFDHVVAQILGPPPPGPPPNDNSLVIT